MDRMQTQTNEFDSLRRLIRAFNNLPAVVDDDYPQMRHFYESEMRLFIDAIRNNGRLT